MSAERIKAIREGLGLTKQQFAQAMGVSLTTVHRWERGSDMPIYQSNLRRLLEIEHALKVEEIRNG
jgi:DNA-binding transcriptional regulator YiaG